VTPESRLLTARELAERLNLRVELVWALARSERIPSLRIPGGRHFLRFSLDEVERVLKGGGNNGETAVSEP